MTADRIDCAGIDGCRGGWAVATVSARMAEATPCDVQLTVVPHFAEALALVSDARCVAVDMPIGLLSSPRPGGRDCDRAARALLGRQGSSVFSPPARPALAAREYREAQRLQGAGLSIQTWNIVPRIREVDAVMTSSLQGRVLEAHPELAFRTLAGGGAALARKASAEGFSERVALLTKILGASMPDLREARARLGAARVGLDDLADALVLADVARRAATGDAFRVPAAAPPEDARGLRMEIWF